MMYTWFRLDRCDAGVDADTADFELFEMTEWMQVVHWMKPIRVDGVQVFEWIILWLTRWRLIWVDIGDFFRFGFYFMIMHHTSQNWLCFITSSRLFGDNWPPVMTVATRGWVAESHGLRDRRAEDWMYVCIYWFSAQPNQWNPDAVGNNDDGQLGDGTRNSKTTFSPAIAAWGGAVNATFVSLLLFYVQVVFSFSSPWFLTKGNWRNCRSR